MKTIIAIDPDVGKSGVAMFAENYSKFEALTFIDLYNLIQNHDYYYPTVVVVEAGWLNRSNWHLPTKCSKQQAAEIGKRTGANHQVGKLIVEYCKTYNIEVVEKRPLKKIWKSRAGKISQEEIEQFIPDFPKRSNQEIRDAALLGWDYLNRPIKIKLT